MKFYGPTDRFLTWVYTDAPDTYLAGRLRGAAELASQAAGLSAALLLFFAVPETACLAPFAGLLVWRAARVYLLYRVWLLTRRGPPTGF